MVSSWEQVVKEPASCADPSLFSEVNKLTIKLRHLPPPPIPVWKKLVQQQQVRSKWKPHEQRALVTQLRLLQQLQPSFACALLPEPLDFTRIAEAVVRD
jgi:hypothetical protein